MMLEIQLWRIVSSKTWTEAEGTPDALSSGISIVRVSTFYNTGKQPKQKDSVLPVLFYLKMARWYVFPQSIRCKL